MLWVTELIALYKGGNYFFGGIIEAPLYTGFLKVLKLVNHSKKNNAVIHSSARSILHPLQFL